MSVFCVTIIGNVALASAYNSGCVIWEHAYKLAMSTFCQ